MGLVARAVIGFSETTLSSASARFRDDVIVGIRTVGKDGVKTVEVQPCFLLIAQLDQHNGLVSETGEKANANASRMK